MATKFLLPLLGQTMEEGTINKWFKNEGDYIEKGEPLLEVMTDKVNMEVEAPVSGILRKIIAPEQAVVPVKDPIAIIGDADENIDNLLAEITDSQPSAPAAQAETTAPVQAPQPPQDSARTEDGRIFASPRAKKAAKDSGLDISLLAGLGTGPGGRIVEKDVLNFLAKAEATKPKITPLAGKVAADLGVDVTGVVGTGPGGRITREDVEHAVPAAPIAQTPSLGRTIPFTGIRKAVAEAMSRSAFTQPQLTHVMEVDMSECVKFREQLNKDLEKRSGIKLTFTDIIIKASGRAIEDFPIVNSSLEPDKIVIHDDVHIAVAVAIDFGLVTPVIRSVRGKTLSAISQELKVLAEKARAGKLSPAELQGGTFTVTNLGAYGIDAFNPIINPPQSAILGVCRIAKRPVVVDDKIEIRPMMNLCLTYDHRVIDGAPAAEFLGRIKDLLENPYLILA